MGSCCFSVLDNLFGAKVSFASFAVFRSEITQKGSWDARGPRVGGDHVIRGNVGGLGGISGWSVLTIASIRKAHLGLFVERSRYFFSLIRSIALFLACRFSRLIPPSSIGVYSLAMLIIGGAKDSHMNSQMIFTRAVSMCFGMPCAAVRNCVIPPANICVIWRFASRVGWPLFHRFRVALTLSSIGSHGSAALALFPIHAPRQRTVFPSWAIFIVWERGRSFRVIFLEEHTLSQCSSVPMGIISVFSRLNLAPEAVHHLDRMFCRAAYESDSERYIVVSSAYRLTISLSRIPGISKPARSGDSLRRQASGSIARLKRRHDRGSP